MRVIHLGTRVVSQFGLLDDAGNVTQVLDVTGNLASFDNNSLLMLGAQLSAKWQELQAEHAPPVAVPDQDELTRLRELREKLVAARDAETSEHGGGPDSELARDDD